MTQSAEEIETLLASALPRQSATGVYPWRCEDDPPTEDAAEVPRPVIRITMRNGKVIDGIVMSISDRKKDKTHVAVWIESGPLRFCYPLEFSPDPKDFSACDIVAAALQPHGDS
jgi:hypothetical protein